MNNLLKITMAATAFASCSKIDYDRMKEQENDDFKKAVEIFQGIYRGRPRQHYEQLPYGCVSDMKMQIGNRKYRGEIKQRSVPIGQYDDIPITVKKYCNLKDELWPQEKLFYLVIGTDNWYLFDLSALDLGDCEIRNWRINDVEYSDEAEKTKIPTIFIPVEKAALHGKRTDTQTAEAESL